MVTCDMCGGSKGPFYNGSIEGTKMKLCSNCKGYAKEAWLIKETIPEEPKKKKLYSQQVREDEKKEEAARGEIVQLVVPDYGKRIKAAREEKGLKQEKLAQQLAVKESLLHTFESGSRKPSLEMARKLEKALHITLVEQQELKPIATPGKRSGAGMTIADMIKKR